MPVTAEPCARPTCVVLAPWRDSGCVMRQRSRDVVLAHWASVGLPVVIGEPDPGPFNRSQAMNRAAVAAGEWDVALLVDLDVITPARQAEAALDTAFRSGRPVIAFHTLVMLSEPETKKVHAGAPPPTSRRGVQGHVSCAVAVTRDVWRTVGGFDERFQGWGAEDRSFWSAVSTFAGPGVRIEGSAWHLWHHVSSERTATRSPAFLANVELADRYRTAGAHFDGGYLARRRTTARRRAADPLPTDPDPDAMRALLAEPGGPLWR